MNNACRAAIVTAVLAAAPASANAAVLDFAVGDGVGGEPSIRYTAGKNERNRLTITTGTRSATLIDPSARMRYGPDSHRHGCYISPDRHHAKCLADSSMVFLIDLGDRGDTLRFEGGYASAPGYRPRTEASSARRLVERHVNTEEAFLERVSVSGGSGDDRIFGTPNTDFVDPGSGSDLVDTAGGRDRIILAPDGRKDRLFAGRGLDTVDSRGETPVTIDLAKQTVTSRPSEADSLNSVERAHGGSGSDVLKGTAFADGLAGDGGADTIDGLAGDDYVAGDVPPQEGIDSGAAADVVRGGPGDDIVDGRDIDDETDAGPGVADQLGCDEGSDLILTRQDDLVGDDCEGSGQGYFAARPFAALIALTQPSQIAPVARGGDGAPTYAIGCANAMHGYGGAEPCRGRVQLERPPEPGSSAAPEVLGSAEFTIPLRSRANVAVTLNDAGRAALAAPAPRVAVHVLMGPNSGSQGADFGWQQVLGP